MSMNQIDESKVVFQLVVEATDAGPRVSLRSGLDMPLERAGCVYGAALSTIMDAASRAAKNMTEAQKDIFYAGIEAAIEHGGHESYMKSFVRVKEKPDDQPDAPADTGPAAG